MPLALKRGIGHQDLPHCYNRTTVPSESASISESVPELHSQTGGKTTDATEAPDPVDVVYRELEAKIREYRPKDDLTALEAAFRFARKHHEGQTRDSGEPYMLHPIMVAHILAD